MRVDRPLARLDCPTVSAGFNSGHLGGKGMSVMLAGIASAAEACQPA